MREHVSDAIDAIYTARADLHNLPMRATGFRLLLPVLALCALWASLSPARAQLQAGLQTDRFNYLLYEPLAVHLTIENLAGFDLLFQDSAEKPWLTFFITRADHSLVSPDQKIAGKDLKLAAGESVSLNVDITPLYRMRETGVYKIQAVIDVGGREYLSTPIQITLENGQRIWSETRAIDGSPRTYSLVRFAPSMQGTNLYLRVEDATQNLVYSNALLGEIVDVGVPQLFFDNSGQLHILQLNGNATYRYTRANADGAILSQSVYDSVALSQPQLVRQGDGGVLVVGGRQENDSTRRERLSDNQARIPQVEAAPVTGPFTPAPAQAGSGTPGGSPPPLPSGSTN